LAMRWWYHLYSGGQINYATTTNHLSDSENWWR